MMKNIIKSSIKNNSEQLNCDCWCTFISDEYTKSYITKKDYCIKDICPECKKEVEEHIYR